MGCSGCASLGDDADVQPMQKVSPNPMSSYLSLKPFLPVKPKLVPPFVDPNYIIDKKADLLNNLFGASSNDIPETKRASLDGEYANSVQPRLVPFSPFSPFSATEKPTVVPPGYWMPMIGPGIVDPSTMLDKKTKFLNTLFSKTPDSSAAVRSVTSESETPEKPTVVPPEFWMPMTGPGIVDPSTMLDKKTKFLNTLFSKISIPDSSAAARSVVSEGETPDLSDLPADFWLQFLQSLSTPEPPVVKPTIAPPGFWIPSSVSKISAKPLSPTIPVIDPSEFIDKKTAFLNTLIKTLNISITPTTDTATAPISNPMVGLKPKIVSPTAKPTIVPPGFWMPASGPGIVDPSTILDKKTKFLNTLFSKISAPGSSTAARSVAPEGETPDTSDPPADFWVQFMSYFSTPTPPTVKPTIVPPGFWIPSAVSKISTKPLGPTIPVIDPSELIDKKTAFLNTLFKTFNISVSPTSETAPEPTSGPMVTSSPAAKPTIVPAGYWMPISGPGIVDPSTVIDKKTKFLNTLFSNIVAPDSSDTSMAQDSSKTQVPMVSRAIFPKEFAAGLPTPKPTIVEPSFWIPNVAPGAAADPTLYMSKVQDFLNKIFANKAAGTSADSTDTTSYDKVRSIKMAVHQGYQSLPPGTEELLQAGGGSNSMDHEGGGLKLQTDEAAVPTIPNSNEGQHHHHNHHNKK